MRDELLDIINSVRMVPLMKRWLALLFMLVLLGAIGFGARYRRQKQAQERRQAGYESVLLSYSQVLKPGMTRKQVEDYLQAQKVKYRQMCCVDFTESANRSSLDDLVKIAEEEVPFVCTENNVYVAFQFTDYQHRRDYEIHDNPLDVLRAVTIHHQLEGCL